MAAMSTRAPLSIWSAVLHLARFDVRRFRVLLAAATALELLRQGYGEWMLHLAPTMIGQRFGGAEGEMEITLLDTALWLLTWIVTAALVQTDHPSDDRAFWRTRPLASPAVALAKLSVLALVFVAVPAFVNAVRLAAYGAPASAYGGATLQIAVLALGAIVPAWALAILTRTLPRFIAGIGAAIVGGYLLFMAFLYYMGAFGAGHMSTGFGLESAGWSHSAKWGWFGALALSAVGLGILVAHYRIRRTAPALAAGVALVVVPGLIPTPDTAVDAPPALARLVPARWHPTDLKVDTGFPSRSSGWAVLAGRLVIPALPRDVSAGVTIGRVRVMVDGRDVAVNGLGQCCLGAAGPKGVASASAFVSPPDSEGWRDELALVRAAASPDLRSKPVTLDAEATIVFMQHRLAASIPFAPGASYRGDGYLVEVLSLSDRPTPPDRTGAALLRLTQFPRLGRGDQPHLSFFHADPARTIVNRATSPYAVEPQAASAPANEWAQARRWAVRFHSIVLHGEDVGPDPRLLIVETRSAGEATTRVTWDGHPAGPR
jgi:hypothetical protein